MQSEQEYLDETIYNRFMKCYLFLFMISLFFNVVIKADLDIWTALFCALGVSLGIATIKASED